jgi:hypothetical protein
MKKFLIALILLTGCQTPEHNEPLPPTYLDMDGTYIMWIDVHSVPFKGPEQNVPLGNQEVIVDQLEDSVNFLGAVGKAREKEIVFNTDYWRRNPGGSGTSTNLIHMMFEGAVNSTAGTITVTREVFADGEQTDGETNTWRFSDYFQSF